MVDLFQKKLHLVFEDGYLFSRTFLGSQFETDPRFFDTIAVFQIFGKPDSIPIEGPFEYYYEKLEVDAFRKFLIGWDNQLYRFEKDNLALTDVPKILNHVSKYSFAEKKSALSLFYGTHYTNVRAFLSKMIHEIPNQALYEPMLQNMRELHEFFAAEFKVENFEQNITERMANALFSYWLTSSANFTKNYFGAFGRWPAVGIV